MTSPADKIVSTMPGWRKTADAAAELGISVSTLRRVIRREKTSAPSKCIMQGGMVIHLFSDSDLEEIRSHITPRIIDRVI